MSIDAREWMDEGACVGNGLPWVEDLRACTRVDLIAMAAVCDTCPVIEQCRDFAVGVEVGFWAGSHREPVQPVAIWQEHWDRLAATSSWVQTVLPVDGTGVDS